MQPLARDGLTDAQVTALLQTAALEVSAGCELLKPDLTLVEDVSDDLVGGTISRSMDATIHGSCALQLTRALRWGIDLVRPYMVLSDGTVTARFNVGVFCLTTPLSVVGESVPVYDVQGYDRLMLLQRQVGADHSAAAGTTYRAALIAAFTAAGLSGVLIEGSAADSVLPATKSWPLVATSNNPDQTSGPVTWLRVVNDLLRAIDFRAVWVDENGRFRCAAYRDPSTRPVEFTFDAADELETIVGDTRTLNEDVWAVPNRWVFRQTNRADGAPTATEGDGIYTVDLNPVDPMSAASRGLVWASVIDYEAADQDKLVSLGNNRVASDRRRTAVFSLTTGPFPCAGHVDVFRYRDVTGDLRVQAVSWQYDLAGSDVTWTWEVV